MSESARNVLVVAYDFAPSSAPGAAMRTSKFVSYLPEFGWRPTVIARREPGRPRGEGEGVVRIDAPRVPLSYQLTAWSWSAVAWPRLQRFVENRAFDLLYVSCPPFPLAWLGSRLARSAPLPMVLDFRDPWSLEPYESKNPVRAALQRGVRRWVWPRLEAAALEAAAVFIVTTDSAGAAYRDRVPTGTRGPIVLPNGFDERDFHEIDATAGRDRRRGSQLNLLYCGRFASVGQRSPGWVFRAIAAMNAEERPVHLHVVGDDSRAVRRWVRGAGAAGFVTVSPTVEHASAIAAMSEYDALVVYQETPPSGVSAVAGKTHEYLRSGKPILVIAPEGDNVALVRRFAGYAVYCTETRQAALMGVLRALHEAWRCGSLPEHAPSKPGFVEGYDRRAQTERLAALFDDALRAAVR